MEAALYFGLAILATLATLITACGAKALREFDRSDMEELCQKRERIDRLMSILRGYESAALVAETLALISAALLIWSATRWMLLSVSESTLGVYLLIGEVLILGLVLMMVASWFPRAVVSAGPERFLFRTWPAWDLLAKLFLPVTWLAALFDFFVGRALGRTKTEDDEEFMQDEIRSAVTESHREGFIAPEARHMIESVIDFAEVEVAEVMTPRTDMICMSKDLSFDEALQFAASTIHTRIPVFQGTRDTIVGIMHTRDLLAAVAERMSNPAAAPIELESVLRKPQFVPESKRINLLLHEFRKDRNHMAIVLDEYGGVAGLVTIEDILEEIVGEIADEYDQDSIDGVKLIDRRAAEALARVHIDEINDRLGIDLPDDRDFDTIGGFVFAELGHVPKVGEEVVVRNIRLKVLDMHGRRIHSVRIEILDQEPSETV